MIQEIPPVMLPAFVVSPTQWAVWCFHCGVLHYHGSLPGARCSHCVIEGSPYKDEIPGYYLVPMGKELPTGALKLHRQGMARVRRHIYARKPHKYTPLPVPEWGKPIYSQKYIDFLTLMWESSQGRSLEQVEFSRQHFNKSWDEYARRWEALKQKKSEAEFYKALSAAHNGPEGGTTA